MTIDIRSPRGGLSPNWGGVYVGMVFVLGIGLRVDIGQGISK